MSSYRDVLRYEPTAPAVPEQEAKEDWPTWVKPGRSFGVLTCIAQLAFLAVFYKGRLGSGVLPSGMDSAEYSCYIGVTLMMFVGFGYLKTFLKAYGLGAVGFTMLIACLGLQWAMILECFVRQTELILDFHFLLNGNMAVAAVLVSFGALIGRISPTQIVMLVLMELPCHIINKVLVLHQFDAQPNVHDEGGTIMVHVFGCYFGLAASVALGPAAKEALRSSCYQSDVFSLIGTVFLWMFWPTFVAAGQVTPVKQSKAMVNTVLALLTSTVTTFGVTQILEDGKIGTQAIQNATLAGGVIIGATACVIGPFGAGLLGMVAGAVSTFAFIRLDWFRKVDTCGVHSLHGVPGLLGGVFSILAPAFYSNTNIVPWDQFIGLAATLLLAGSSGFLCGLALKAVEYLHDDKELQRVAEELGLEASDLRLEHYSDAAYWRNADAQPNMPLVELGAIDYRLVDEVVDPIDTTQPFSEELVRIPGCFLCYTPPTRIPEVEALPALRGYVTFGSFSCLAKVGEPVVALWARCLHEVPNSRLLVKNKGFYSPDVQATFIAKFKAYGIPEHRLKLMALAPTSYEHLNIYNEVDIALDTFPYSNTTTTCESLLMGVPAVCLVGSTHGSRVCYTLLSAIGLAEFAAQTQEAYVTKVKGLCSNLQTLAMLRKNLRQIMLSSALCDGSGFVRDKFEPILREKWLAYCNGRQPSQQVFSGNGAPDPLAPGPFAAPLAPGQHFVQPAQTAPQAGMAVAAATSNMLGAPVAPSAAMPLIGCTLPPQVAFCGGSTPLMQAAVLPHADVPQPMSPDARSAWQVAPAFPICAQLPGQGTPRHRRQRNNRIHHPARRA
ncbi:unnamed protein product [Effrenium voratum]|uniref:Ammonium transporter AmtB-like domain-containing protein n=1 Tax=Effrenium voratum TaxID=2562239 RepID=A0AA36NMZ3_9DINO|nr:unnamed protein product [Effrenium voratum]